MADRKVKVWNRSKGNHTFVFADGMRKIPIPAGSFQLVPIEEVYYVDASSRSFRKGILEIDASEIELREELGYSVSSPNSITIEEIKQLYSGAFSSKIKDRLKKITERHAFERLIEVAREMDLSKSKIDFIEEITGMEVFNELIDAEIKNKNKNKNE